VPIIAAQRVSADDITGHCALRDCVDGAGRI
jgi:hypothetical protein